MRVHGGGSDHDAGEGPLTAAGLGTKLLQPPHQTAGVVDPGLGVDVRRMDRLVDVPLGA